MVVNTGSRLHVVFLLAVFLAGCDSNAPTPAAAAHAEAAKRPTRGDGWIWINRTVGDVSPESKERVHDTVVAKWLLDESYTRVDEDDFLSHMERYAGRRILRTELVWIYGEYEFSARGSTVVLQEGEPLESPLEQFQGTRVRGQSTVEGLVREIQAVPEARLELSAASDSRIVFLQKSLDVAITVKNSGRAASSSLTVVETLPESLDYMASDPAGLYRPAQGAEGATISWKLDSVASGESVTIKVTLRAGKTGEWRSSVRVEETDARAGVKVRVVGVPALHISTYDTEDPVQVGQQTIFVVELRNEGTSPCTNLALVDVVPEEMELVRPTGPTDHRVDGNRVIFEPVPVLGPGDKLVYKVVCRVTTAGSATNTAEVRYDQFDKPIIDEEGTSCYR